MLPACLLTAYLLCAAPPGPPPAGPERAGKVDFSGIWKLDLKASDPLDELLAAQGASWVERKAAGSVVVTQKVAHKPDRLEVCVESSLKSKCTTTRIGAGWEERQTDQGRIRGRADWSADGKSLLIASELTLKDGKPAQLDLTRTLEDQGKTTVQLIELKTKDGKSYKVRRILRLQAK